MELLNLLNMTNYVFVLFFGVTASLVLAGIPFSEHKRLYIFTLAFFGAVQLLAYLLLGEATLYKCYPVLIHLPLIFLIAFGFGKNIYVSMIAVLLSYLLCTPRKWFGTLISYFFGGDMTVFYLSAILITLPILFLTANYIAPYVIRLKDESRATMILFFILPLAYYILEYAFTVYTDLLYTGGAVVIDFVDSFTVLLYFVLSMLSLEFSNQKSKAEHENILLAAAAAQAQKELSQLSASAKQAAIYRHDLRHHMNFLKSCIAENRLDQANAYITEICDGLEASQLKKYCDNEAVNLILSSYITKAEEQQISVDVSVRTSDFSRFQIPDLCSLFANGLENAIHASTDIQPPENRHIALKLYEKNDRLCIQLINRCANEPVFEHDIPVSTRKDHGIGVRSMISVVEKYHGVYGFSADHGEFRFQASL